MQLSNISVQVRGTIKGPLTSGTPSKPVHKIGQVLTGSLLSGGLTKEIHDFVPESDYSFTFFAHFKST